jgi:hypothetical protein
VCNEILKVSDGVHVTPKTRGFVNSVVPFLREKGGGGGLIATSGAVSSHFLCLVLNSRRGKSSEIEERKS